MTEAGLVEVLDPSKTLLSQRYDQSVGSALAPVLEGSRPLLLEVQALTSYSHLPSPRRVANGVDHNRLLMLTAVAGRRGWQTSAPVQKRVLEATRARGPQLRSVDWRSPPSR